MADFGANVKKIWLKSMEAIGNTASNIASNTRSKVDEMNLVTRRSEILKEFGNQAYSLWQKGERFPEELEKQLRELEKLDEQLNDLRAERLAGVKTEKTEMGSAEETPETETQDPEAAIDQEDEKPQEIPVIRVEKTETEADSAAAGAESANPPAEKADPETSTVEDAIDALFDKLPTAQEAQEQVNQALDSLGESLKQFSSKLDEKLNDLNDHMQGE